MKWALFNFILTALYIFSLLKSLSFRSTAMSEWNWIKLILCTKRPKFTMLFYYIEMPTRSCLPDMFLPLMRPFKWGTAWSSISRGIRNTSSQTFDHTSLLNKIGLFCNFLLWLVVILMPLETKLHAVPHLKGLINLKNIFCRQECVCTFL